MPNPERGRGPYYLRRAPPPPLLLGAYAPRSGSRLSPNDSDAPRRPSGRRHAASRLLSAPDRIAHIRRQIAPAAPHQTRRDTRPTTRKRTLPGRVEDISEKPQTFSVPAEPGILYSRGAPLLSIAAGTTPAAVARRMRASQRLKAVARISRRERRRSCPGDYRAVLGPRQPRCFDLTERLLVFSGNDSRRITR